MEETEPKPGPSEALARTQPIVTPVSDFPRQLRRKRRVSRELDRVLEGIYGRRPEYPREVA